jgi:YidC/Oxa1 family membrane protein insertase
MDYRKIALYAALVVVALLLWNSWQREFPATKPVANTTASQPATPSGVTQPSKTGVPSVPQSNHGAQQTHSKAPVVASSKKNKRLITVKTDVLNVAIDTLGGNLEQAALINYKQEDNPQQPVALFNQNPSSYYVAESGLTGKLGPDTQKGQVTYRAAKSSYTMTKGQKSITVDLTWRNAQGLRVTKSYVFTRGSYAVAMHYKVQNQGGKPWTGYVYTQLARTQPGKTGSVLTHYATFTGAAVSSPSEHYQKLKFKNFASEPLNQNATDGWAAMIQQYFLSAWVPPAKQNYHYYTTANNDIYTVGMIGPAQVVQPGQSMTTTNTLYVGPAIASNLDKLSPHLSMTIDYGWLWFISKIIFWIMKIIHGVIGNWGWSIILTTIVIKVIFYPLSDKSFKSMAGMRKLQPKMAALKERHDSDRQAISKATMELYKTEKVNPLSGCLPIVIQIPVFIGLYWVIMQSVEFRMAPWMFWIKDLSVHDPYYILPVIMGVLMFLQQKLSPPPADPTQAKVMMFMPVIFTVFFLHFPAGLVLYWITNTLFTILHQLYVYKRVANKEKALKLKR